MRKSTALTLLTGFLLSCGSSGGGGGGGGGLNESNANQMADDAICSTAFRCKDGMLGKGLLNQFGMPATQAACVMTLRDSDKKEPQGDLPCPAGKMLDTAQGQKCLAAIAAADCNTLPPSYNAACDKNLLCVTKTSNPGTGGTGGSGGSGFPGTGGNPGTGGSSFPNTGGSGPPGQGGDSGSDPCDICLTQKCGSQTDACDASPMCVALLKCALACPSGDAACQQTCANQNPQGVAPLNAFLSCFKNSCGTECQ